MPLNYNRKTACARAAANQAGFGTSLQLLIAAGVADYVRSEGCMSDALDLLEHRFSSRQQVAESIPAKAAEEWSKDFAEFCGTN